MGVLGVLGDFGGNFLPRFFDQFWCRLLAGTTGFIDSDLP
jgi:hypothetical protein